MHVPELQPAGSASTTLCVHVPPCPDRHAPDAQAARIATDHPEQGWTLLCNGLVLFDHVPLTVPAAAGTGS